MSLNLRNEIQCNMNAIERSKLGLLTVDWGTYKLIMTNVGISHKRRQKFSSEQQFSYNLQEVEINQLLDQNINTSIY